MAEIKVLSLLTQLKIRLGKRFNNNSLPNKNQVLWFQKHCSKHQLECITPRYYSAGKCVKKGGGKVILSPLI